MVTTAKFTDMIVCVYMFLFKQKAYSHHVLIFLEVPGIPVKKLLQSSW